jgi:triosephosphate isomerase
MRSPIIAGNWKMYKTPGETCTFFEKFRPLIAGSNHCEIVICPPFVDLGVALESVAEA